MNGNQGGDQGGNQGGGRNGDRPDGPDPGEDREFDAYLRGDSELSREYRRGSTEEPPSALDTAILSEAKRAVTSKRVAYTPFSQNWMVPTSLAAVLVLTVSVVALLPKPDSGLELDGLRSPERSAAPTTVVPAPATLETERTIDLREQADADAPAFAPAPAELQSPRRARAKEQRRNEPQALPRQLLDESKASGGKSSAEASSADESSAGAGSAGDALNSSEAAGRAGATMRQAPAAPAAADDLGLIKREDAKREAELGKAEKPSAEQQPREVRSPVPESIRRSPDTWATHIEALLARGDTLAAEQELDEFRQRYPDYPLPRVLQQLAH